MDDVKSMIDADERAVADAGVPTEKQMRDAEPPNPNTVEQLVEIITALTDRPHSYGTCVYAMSHAAVAAFNYVAHRLGVTGFQASCADMDILRHTRGFKWGAIVNYDDLLYPQYRDKVLGFDDLLAENAAELAKRATELLAALDDPVHPHVVAHWKKLVASAPKETPRVKD